jgi:hypothetical protein
MRNLEQIEVVFAKILSVKATGRAPIWAALGIVVWVTSLYFLYLIFSG